MSPQRRSGRRPDDRPGRRPRSSARVGTLVRGRPVAKPLDVDALLDDRSTEIIVCCGSGGVGKTTTAAALALRAAERGRSVVVLTIDPARRLAQSLGLTKLGNTPRAVDAGPAAAAAGGSLDAMMLDMKRTFDEVVEAHASPGKAQQLLANPFYVALSSSFGGTQEYMAMEKLGQLHARERDKGGWDLIVVDTPPSRSALDFLDAPEHLSSLLDGRLIRLLVAPAKGPARLLNAGLNVVTGALTKVLGAQVLRDVQTFIAAFDTLFGGFRQRAVQTYALLQAPHTAFLVVATPDPDALREAAYFVERLSEDRMPLAGVVLNRVTADAARGLLVLHAERSGMRGRQLRLIRRFAAAHPSVATAAVAALAGDVHDVDGLRRIGELMADPDGRADVSA
jgi:anion-transporting  ArsA/GET3 family ATPase